LKTYPSIPSSSKTRTSQSPLYVFDKLDGSNMRVEWSKKKGFYKYGCRKRLIDSTDAQFGDVPLLFESEYQALYQAILEAQGWDRSILFFEYHGENSFAGNHSSLDPKRLTLIDVSVHKKGFLSPKDFLTTFGSCDHAQLLYQGTVDEDLIQSVKDGTLPGMTFEGVIVKGLKSKNGPGMFKIKSQAWYDKLRDYCGSNQSLFHVLK
jgi:hypothetical protein